MVTRSAKIFTGIAAIVIILACLSFYSVITFKRSNNYLTKQVCPSKVNASTEENVQLMRRNLEAIAQRSPLQDIVGQVIFKQGITAKDFIRLANKYHIHIAGKSDLLGGSSIQLLRSSNPNGTSDVQGLELTADYFQEDTFEKAVKENAPPDPWLPENSSSTSTSYVAAVINFSANAQANDFLNLWKENGDIVRAIGVGCTRIFYIVSPSDPIRLGGPSLLR